MKLLKAFRLFWFENGLLRCSLSPTFFGGGGGGPQQSTSTVTQSSIPDWLQPQTEAMLGAATQQIFNTDGSEITGIKGFNPYSANPSDYVAPFSPLQQQSIANAANIQTPGQYNAASDIAANTARGALGSTGAALGYGAQGANYGGMGAEFGLNQAQGLGGQATYYGGQGAGYGGAAAGLAGQGLGYQAAGNTAGDIALGYGNQGLGYGAQGAAGAQGLGGNVARQAMGYGTQAAQQGDIYGQMVTNPNTVQSYMSPYQQAVTDVAKTGALRDYQIGQTYRQANAARVGAYGGGRQAIENAEAQRNLNTQLQNLDVQGQQSAYNAAMQNIQNQAQQRLQGLQGAQQGLGTTLSAGQLGLAGTAQGLQATQAAQQGVQNYLAGQNLGLSGLGAANQAYQTGISGANLGLQGVSQGTNAAQLGLAGTAQGMQGAGVGLSGVQGAQQGYGLGTQAGTALSNIGTQQLAAQRGIVGLQNQYGQQQTQQQQDIINNAIQNYASAQQYPMQQLGMYNALLRGYATPTSGSTTYQAAPSALSQFGGLAATGLGAYMAKSAKTGGVIDEPKKYAGGGLVDLAIANAMGDAE
jgi:hypothetical protein